MSKNLPESYSIGELYRAAECGEIIVAFSALGTTAVVAAKGGRSHRYYVAVYTATEPGARFEKRQSLIGWMRRQERVVRIALSCHGRTIAVGVDDSVVVYEFGSEGRWRLEGIVWGAAVIAYGDGLFVEENDPDGYTFAITDDGLIKLTDSQMLSVS